MHLHLLLSEESLYPPGTEIACVLERNKHYSSKECRLLGCYAVWLF
jgi:hypothetical protein